MKSKEGKIEKEGTFRCKRGIYSSVIPTGMCVCKKQFQFGINNYELARNLLKNTLLKINLQELTKLISNFMI